MAKSRMLQMLSRGGSPGYERFVESNVRTFMERNDMQGSNFVGQGRIFSRGRAFLVVSTVLGLILALRTALSNATVFELPADGSTVIGADTTITTHYQDTLLDIARKYSLGYDEIVRANP